MPKVKKTVRQDQLDKGDVILTPKEEHFTGVRELYFEVEREVPYTQGTILLIKTGHGPGGDYTLGQVAERIGIGHTNQGSWLSTRGEGRYLSDADIDALIEKSGGVQVLRDGTGI